MSYNNENEDYYEEDIYDDEEDDVYEYDEAAYSSNRPGRAGKAAETEIARQAFDWGITGSILAIIVLTAIYTLSPIDAIPDFVPLAGQADDLAAIFAGGGSVTFLAVLRFVMRSRVARWGCLLVIVLSAIGAFAIFLLLIELFNSVF